MICPVSQELTRSQRTAIRQLVNRCANYDSTEKICLPLDCPCYMRNKWWTGSLCRYFREGLLPTDPLLEAALQGAVFITSKQCPVCGKPFIPVTSQAYCSDVCRIYARRKSERERKRRERQTRA